MVTDGSGNPLSGVQVSTQPASGIVTTDVQGAYNLSLTSGTYNVLFNAAGYNSNFVGSVFAPAYTTATANQTLVMVPPGSAQDLFSRPDQIGLGTASDGHAWSNDFNVYPTGVVTISGRQAFVQTEAANTDHDTWMGIAYRDQEVTADMDMTSVLSDPNYQHGSRLLARVQGSDSWIVMALNPSNDTLTIWVDAAGSWTQIGSAGVSFQTNTWYHAKLDVIGSSAYGKAWPFGTAEPGAWQVTGWQTNIMSAGVAGLRCGAADAYFGNFRETPITQISGTVTDSTGVAVAGANVTLSNGATTVTDANGAYLFPLLGAGTYAVTATAAAGQGSATASISIGLSATANVALNGSGGVPPPPHGG